MIPQNFDPVAARNTYLYVWIDILGFSEALNDEQQYKKLISLLKKFRSKFENLLSTEKALTISDGIVLVFRPNNTQSVIDVFTKIAETQLEFIKENDYLLRGGMAVGSIYPGEEDENLRYLVSNGLSNAYLSESNFISYPVIGISKEQLEKLNNMLALHIENDVNYYNLLKTASKYKDQPLYFVDFLDVLDGEDVDLRNFIENKLMKYRNNPSVLEKYIWLYRYCCEKFGGFDIEKIGEIINE